MPAAEAGAAEGADAAEEQPEQQKRSSTRNFSEVDEENKG